VLDIVDSVIAYGVEPLHVTFRSGARTLVPGDTHNTADIIVCDVE
jgi:hypothetical protein